MEEGPLNKILAIRKSKIFIKISKRECSTMMKGELSFRERRQTRLLGK